MIIDHHLPDGSTYSAHHDGSALTVADRVEPRVTMVIAVTPDDDGYRVSMPGALAVWRRRRAKGLYAILLQEAEQIAEQLEAGRVVVLRVEGA